MPNLIQENQNNNNKKIDPSVYQLNPKKRKSSRWWWSTLILLFIVIVIGLGFLTKIVLAINSTNSQTGEKIGFFEQIKHLLINPEKEIKGESDDRLNMLLIGIGGAGHPGSYLADTIIVASLKPSTKEVAFISIPRDLYVEIPDYGWRKINNAFAFGHGPDYPGGGEALLKEIVEDVTGLPIHYYARLDFEGFRKAIDDVGGIDIYVENSFTDYEYPDYNYGYQTISFKKGWEHMSGERALQFVRSRHGTSGEGSDFARSKRQQKVLFAVKERIFSINTFINPASIISALDNLGNHNRTDLEAWEILKLSKIVQDTAQDKIITQVLETGANGQLVSDTTLDGAYILRPKVGNFSEIQYLAKNIFNASIITREKARIEIQNSTAETGLATKTADRLKTMKYNIINVGNAETEDAFEKTTIYDLSNGTKPYTIISLKNTLKASVSSNLPAFMTPTNPNYKALTSPPANVNINANESDIDILIIIGNDMVTTTQLSARLSSSPPSLSLYQILMMSLKKV